MIKNKKYWLLVLMLLSVWLSIGYSAFNTKLEIDDINLTVKIDKDIRVDGFNIDSITNSSISNYEEYDYNKLIFGINLPNSNSTVKYKVKVTNYGNVDMGIYDITGLPDNLEYTFEDYTLKNKICNSSNVCNSGISKEFYITIKYKTDGYDSSNISYNIHLELLFKPIYQISYVNIDNSDLPTEIIESDTLELDLSSKSVPVTGLLVDNQITRDYTYENNILTLNNISNNLEIHNPYYEVYNNGTFNSFEYDLNTAYSQITSSTGEIKLMQDVNDTTTISIESGKNINLNTNENKLTTSSQITINSGGILNVGGNGILENSISQMFYVGGTLNINDENTEVISENTEVKRLIYVGKGTFNMNDGLISSKTPIVYVSSTNGGNVNINGGKLLKNDVGYSNEVIQYHGLPNYSFNLNGGTIESNFTTTKSNVLASIFISNSEDSSEVNLTGTYIINSVFLDGTYYGINLSSYAKLKMTGGIIKSTTPNDGGICNQGYSELFIFNGEINVLSVGISNLSSNANTYIYDGTIIGSRGILNNGTVTLGVDDGIIENNIIIRGEKYGIRSYSGTVINYYDGLIQSPSTPIGNLGTTNLAGRYTTDTRNVTIDGTNYNEMYLTPTD